MNKWQRELLRLTEGADKATEKRLRQIFQKTLGTLEEETDKLLGNDEVKFWQLFRASTLHGMQNQVNSVLYENYEEVLNEGLSYLQLKQQLSWDEVFYDATQQFNIDFNRVDLNQAYALANYSEEELANRLAGRLYSNTNELASRIVDKLDKNLLTGMSSQRIAKEIMPDIKDMLRKEVNSEYNKAIRIVRTENTKISGEAKQSSLEHAESLGIEMKKQWVSSLDSRTRSSHGHLDGKTIGVDEYFEINGDTALAPGGFSRSENSINCRCKIISVIENYQPKTRRATVYDESGKKTCTKLTKYKTYNEWKEAD